MLKVNQLDGFGSENKRAIVEFISSAVASGSVVTFTNQDIGPVYADRYIVVAFTGDTNGRTISSVTIGGITATQHVVQSGYPAGIYGAYVPTGTTATIVITLSGSEPIALSVYNIRGLRSSTALNTATGTESPDGTVTTSLNVGLGFYIAVSGSSSSSSGTWTWTNATEVFDTGTTRPKSGAFGISYREQSISIVTVCTTTGGSAWMIAAAFT